MMMRRIDVDGDFAGAARRKARRSRSSRGWRELTQPQQVVGGGSHVQGVKGEVKGDATLYHLLPTVAPLGDVMGDAGTDGSGEAGHAGRLTWKGPE